MRRSKTHEEEEEDQQVSQYAKTDFVSEFQHMTSASQLFPENGER